jgi:uroporphyrin-3 C-methyltransferase
VSDKDDKNIEQIGEEGAASEAAAQETAEVSADAASPAPAPAVAVAAATPPAQPPAPPPAAKKGSSAIAWLALLLVLALGGGAIWYLMELQQREVALVQRLAAVESRAGVREDSLTQLDGHWRDQLSQLEQRWQKELQDGLTGLRGGLAGLSDADQSHAGSIQAMDGQLSDLREILSQFSPADRDSWLMAEAEYLLRLANQRLIMAGDTVSAQALMTSADGILRDLDTASLHETRAALAADLAAVRAVPRVDVEGIYLRLAALIEQADALVIFEMPEQEQRLQEAPAETWQDRLEQGYESALVKLSDYIVIRRRDVPMQALMDPQWEGLVRQNMRMLLEQAQVALLSGNQTLFTESLERARHWVAEFFESDEEAARAMAREIDQLADQRIAVDIPDIARSLEALDAAIERRLEQGGGE